MSYPGLETLYRIFKAEIGQRTDLLVLLLHWRLVKDGVLCVGSGQDKSRQGLFLYGIFKG